MLSYRHAYHAGNYADVLKHIVLVEILDYLTQKEKGFVYIDTHAGAGGYELSSQSAQKTGEYRQGIGKLDLEALENQTNYAKVLAGLRSELGDDFYPGSPMFASALLRSQDSAWLFELHSSDFTHLGKVLEGKAGFHIRQEDGLAGLISQLPPTQRRGCVLVDPSYEIKDDYRIVVDSVAKAYRKFATGVYALWYPVIERGPVEQFKRRLQKVVDSHTVCFELCVESDSGGRGMTGSGMIVINPPWKLTATMQTVLPELTRELGQSMDASYVVEVLVPE